MKISLKMFATLADIEPDELRGASYDEICSAVGRGLDAAGVTVDTMGRALRHRDALRAVIAAIDERDSTSLTARIARHI